MYTLKDWNNQPIIGSFYTDELTRISKDVDGRGWSGGAKVLGKLSVPGRPTSLAPGFLPALSWSRGSIPIGNVAELTVIVPSGKS